MPAGRYTKTMLTVYYPVAHLKDSPTGMSDIWSIDDQIVDVVNHEPGLQGFSSDGNNRTILFVFHQWKEATEAMFRVLGEPKLRAYRIKAEVASS